jgi:hypothetical protein
VTTVRRIAVAGWLVGCGAWAWSGVLSGAEDKSLPPYRWPDAPRYRLWTDHEPLRGWRIEKIAKGTAEVYLRQSGRDRRAKRVPDRDNPCLRGVLEDVFLLHFDPDDYRAGGGPALAGLGEGSPRRPVFLGWDYHDFSTRFHRWTGERGLCRRYVIPGEFGGIDALPLDLPGFGEGPEDGLTDEERFLLPVVAAEGEGDFLVLNTFDRAGMTVGFIQMAAHTPDDLISLMKHLVGHEGLRADAYADPRRWFPELGLTADGKLGYRTSRDSGTWVALEDVTRHRGANEGFSRKPGWAYYREDFVRFGNPDVTRIDDEELHFAARWLMWSLSPAMRRAQVEPSLANVASGLRKLQVPRREVPAVAAALAAVILHWNDGVDSRKRVERFLAQPDPVAAFYSLESRPGQKDAVFRHATLLSRQQPWFQVPDTDRQVLNRRVESVRLFFQRRPEVLARLRRLGYDLETGTLREIALR